MEIKDITYNGDTPCAPGRLYMLPTDRSYLTISGGRLSYDGVDYAESGFIKPQNLYIVVDELIKKGDKVLRLSHGEIFDAPSDRTEKSNDFKKIVATNDSNLTMAGAYHPQFTVDKTPIKYQLPQIPRELIEKYCSRGGIDEVLLECERMSNKGEWKDVLLPSEWGDHNPLRIKVDSENMVTTHVVEKIYTRDEVEHKFLDQNIAIAKHILAGGTFQNFDHQGWMQKNL